MLARTIAVGHTQFPLILFKYYLLAVRRERRCAAHIGKHMSRYPAQRGDGVEIDYLWVFLFGICVEDVVPVRGEPHAMVKATGLGRHHLNIRTRGELLCHEA